MTEQHFGSMGMDWNDYVKLFMNVKTETAIGEASVRYLWSKTVAAYIHAKIPHVQDSHGPERSGGSGILRISGSTCGWCAAMLVSQVRGIESCLVMKAAKFFFGGRFLKPACITRAWSDTWIGSPERASAFSFTTTTVQSLVRSGRDFSLPRVDSSFKPDVSKRHNEPRVPRFISLNRFLNKQGVLNRLATLCPSGKKPRPGSSDTLFQLVFMMQIAQDVLNCDPTIAMQSMSRVQL